MTNDVNVHIGRWYIFFGEISIQIFFSVDKDYSQLKPTFWIAYNTFKYLLLFFPSRNHTMRCIT